MQSAKFANEKYERKKNDGQGRRLKRERGKEKNYGVSYL